VWEIFFLNWLFRLVTAIEKINLGFFLKKIHQFLLCLDLKAVRKDFNLLGQSGQNFQRRIGICFLFIWLTANCFFAGNILLTLFFKSIFTGFPLAKYCTLLAPHCYHCLGVIPIGFPQATYCFLAATYCYY
jgi:hypothetical protein